MAKKTAPALASKPNPQLVKTRVEGLSLISPLRPLVSRVHITNDEQYLEADNLLGRIRNNRTIWKQKKSPISDPIELAMKELKKSLEGVKALDKDIDGPLEAMELAIKGEMRRYKMEEAENKRLEAEVAEQAAERLRLEAAKVRVQESSAVTTQMKAKLAQKRAELEAQADLVEEAPTTEIKGSMSTSRTIEKVRIADPEAFLKALTDYQPRAGVWEMGKPPLSLLTLHTKRDGTTTPEGSALEKVESEITKIHALTPGIVASWPGVEVFDDIIIAGR